MWLLGINVGHNGSAALYKDSELIFYIEEDRLSRLKYDGNPFLGIEKAFEYTDHIDFLVLCATRNAFGMVPWTGEDAYTCYVRKKQPGRSVETIKLGDDHHLTHALTAFYNSGFDDAAAVVVDGAGSGFSLPDHEQLKHETWEVESIWSLGYPAEIQKHAVNYGTNHVDSFVLTDDGCDVEISDAHGIVKSYEAVTQFLGFHAIEAGKTMGLAPYGKFNENIKIDDDRFNNRAFIKPKFPAGNVIRCDLNTELKELEGDIAWHNDPDLVGEYRKDLAYAVQKSAEKRVIALIRRAIEITGKKKIVMAGGFGLNCVANYEYLKEFPDVEFYHEPASHDGGNVMGACQYVYRSLTKDIEKAPLTSLYIGPDNSANYDNIDYEGFDVKDSSAEEVAKIISDGNIVCLYRANERAVV